MKKELLTLRMKQVLIDEVPRARGKLSQAALDFREGDIQAGMDRIDEVFDATGRWMQTLQIPVEEIKSLRAATQGPLALSPVEAITYVETLSAVLEALFLAALDDSGRLNDPDHIIMPSNN